MNNIQSAGTSLRLLDDLATQDTALHRLHPLVKILVTLVFLVVVVSFPKYELLGLVPLIGYPMILLIVGDLPAGYFLKKVLLAAPFVFFVAIFNPIFDSEPWRLFGLVTISRGWISFLVVLGKFGLTVMAALLLIATTGLNDIGAVLLRLKIPKVLVTQILFMYRYIDVLLDEIARVSQAYAIRSVNHRGVDWPVWGSLVGQLLMRTLERAERIHQAMLCRGFDGKFKLLRTYRWGYREGLYLSGWSVFLVVARYINIPGLLGSILTGVGR